MDHNFVIGLGHGIGLDVHEPPFLTMGDDTDAPKWYDVYSGAKHYPGSKAFSARVEDIVVIEDGKARKLTKGFQELFVVD